MSDATARPLLAATMIVRDEAPLLADCLRSLRGVVDEMHVHDTGSVDETPELATSMGATVTRGKWHDDFGAARNEGLEAVRADWALSVDPGNRLVANRTGLRKFLAGTTADVLRVQVDHEHERVGYRHEEVRLFRPAAVRWQGTVNERLVGRDGPVRTESIPRDVLRLRHIGYASAGARRTKAQLRVELGRAAVDELAAMGDEADPAVVAHTLLDLGRSLVAAERQQDAVDVFEALRDLCPGTDEWLHATDFLARLVLGAGMDEICLLLMGQMREAGANSAYCDWLEAQALAQLGDVETARVLLEGVSEVVDTVGRVYDPAALGELKRLVGRLRVAAQRT